MARPHSDSLAVPQGCPRAASSRNTVVTVQVADAMMRALGRSAATVSLSGPGDHEPSRRIVACSAEESSSEASAGEGEGEDASSLRSDSRRVSYR